MEVSARLLFKDFSLTWLSAMNEKQLMPIALFPDLTPELIKKLKIENGVEASMSCWLLETEGKKILFDTGLPEDKSKLQERLKEIKINPNEIDYIFITHFHFDHIGGLVNSKGEIVFKNAKIYTSKKEYDGWIKDKKEGNEMQKNVMKACEKQLIKFDFKDELPLGIKPIEAFGHTPGHTVYQKGKLLIIGDLIHGEAFQFDHPEISSKFDEDPKGSIDTRKKILKYAQDNKLFVVGMHLSYKNFAMFKKWYQE